MVATMILRLLVVSILLGLASPAVADAPLSPGREKAIRKLLQLTRAGEMATTMMDTMAGQLRPMFKNVPESFWSEFFREMDTNEPITKIVPIYARHLSDKEVDELIRFYESPIGRKLISVQPMIMQESMGAGKEWGRQVGERVVQKLRDKGLVKPGVK